MNESESKPVVSSNKNGAELSNSAGTDQPKESPWYIIISTVILLPAACIFIQIPRHDVLGHIPQFVTTLILFLVWLAWTALFPSRTEKLLKQLAPPEKKKLDIPLTNQGSLLDKEIEHQLQLGNIKEADRLSIKLLSAAEHNEAISDDDEKSS